MRSAVTLGLFLLASTLALALPKQSQPLPPPDPSACAFTIHGDPARATIKGPDDIVPLVYVVEQPDSPIEITAVDLTGMSLYVANNEFTIKSCEKYTVRNRSDRIVEDVLVQLAINHVPGGHLMGRVLKSPLTPGQSTEMAFCNGGGRGGARDNRVRVLVSVSEVRFSGCVYSPSTRIPRSLGLPY